MEAKGYYSLVQFSPDLSRGESVNIGVVVYSPTKCQTSLRLIRNNAKIKQFFGKQDWSFISYSKESLESRLSREVFTSRTELQSFIDRRANAIQMTELQPISIRDLEKDTDLLFDELVVQTKTPRRKRIDKTFGEQLLAAGVRGLVKQSVQVKFPFFDEPLRAPFAFQNGRFNLLSPIQFGSDLRELLSKVGEKAVEGELLYMHPDPTHGNLCLNVVAKFADDVTDRSRQLVEKVLTQHKVKLYSIDNLEPLVREIRAAAADHQISN